MLSRVVSRAIPKLETVTGACTYRGGVLFSSFSSFEGSQGSSKYPFFSICKNQAEAIKFQEHIDKNWKRNYAMDKPSVMTIEEYENNRPVFDTPSGEPPLDIDNFYKHLHTKYMGHTLLYSHELTSTQTILMDNFRNYQSGLVCVADKQISGHGRSTNKWDSPYGCLMFSFKTHITNPRDLPMLQYLTTLVMCNSLEDIYNTGDMDIAIKWPNDIYYHRDKKVGGIICQSFHNGRAFEVTIGVGINISNKKPTTCMDEIASSLQKKEVVLGRSTVLASFCNQFTEAIRTFRTYGFEPFMKDYMDTWMHTGETVTVVSDDDESVKMKAYIEGINCMSGMLQAKTDDGEMIELFPDTHSFNLMDRLLYKKKN